jgi:hypothetical protein
VRDPESLVGKGFGYLNLTSPSAVLAALTKNEAMFQEKYKLRVSVCKQKTKKQITTNKDNSTGSKNKVPKDKDSAGGSTGTGTKMRHRDLSENALAALKRMKKKAKQTKKKLSVTQGIKQKKKKATKAKRPARK